MTPVGPNSHVGGVKTVKLHIVKFARLTQRFKLSLIIATLCALALSLDATSPSLATGSQAEMFAYTSANNGRWSFKIQASDAPVVVATVGDMAVTCGNMNLANNAGTKVYQSYNCNGSNKQFTEIDVATNSFQSFIVSERTHTMAISPDDRYMYFADPYYTFKFDLSTNPPTHVAGGSRDDNNAGINLGILPNGTKLYSASVQRNKVQVFNSSLALVATVTDPAFSSLRWALPNPSGSEVWVGFGSTYKIIDSSTDTISRTISATFGTGSLPSFSPDGKYLYTSSGTGLEKVDTATGLSVATYVGSGLANGTHAAISPDGTYVYVANGSSVGWVNLSNGNKGLITLPVTTPTESTKTIAWVRKVSPPSIALSLNSISTRIGSVINSSYTITNSGGEVASYSISPTLPTGLSLNSSNGLIYGTPTITSTMTTYTLTATNVSGAHTANFTLEITEEPTSSPTQTSMQTSPSATNNQVTVTQTNKSTTASNNQTSDVSDSQQPTSSGSTASSPMPEIPEAPVTAEPDDFEVSEAASSSNWSWPFGLKQAVLFLVIIFFGIVFSWHTIKRPK